MRWIRTKHGELNSHTSTVHVMLQGGLGNQLFQFANGVARSIQLNVPLVLEDQMLVRDKLRDYSLHAWGLAPNVPYQFAIKDELLQFKESISIDSEGIQTIQEESFHYTEISERLQTGVSYRFLGYWQSDLNFSLIQSFLKKFLRAGLISENSIGGTSLHIRRGDFVNNPKTLAYHGILDFEYYVMAISLLDENTREIDVICDSFQEIHDLIAKLEIATGKIFNLRTDLIDDLSAIRSLATSSQIIIANSSFSWWGAYLSEARKVIAPRKYFSEKTLRELNISDLYPKGWILV